MATWERPAIENRNSNNENKEIQSEKVRYHHKAEICWLFMFALGFNLVWKWAAAKRNATDWADKNCVFVIRELFDDVIGSQHGDFWSHALHVINNFCCVLF